MAACRRPVAGAIFHILLRFLALIVSSLTSPVSCVTVASSSHQHSPSVGATRRFWIENDTFWKDDRPFQIIGGELHYFRVVPQYWRDRLFRAKALGLNTIQTYVPWNLHEPKPMKWEFEGIADVEAFIKLAQELGFLVMLRAGPYTCGEWDLGGFPAWLLAIEPQLKFRTSDPAFLSLVERWWGALLPKILPLLYANGGPVIMVQVENEFGSFGDDKNYLHELVKLARSHLGRDTILYTTDGGTRNMLNSGSITEDDVLAAVDFSTGDNPWPIFELQKQYNLPGKSPPITTEFYTGWLTHWGERTASTDANYTANALGEILSRNASAVLYMAHGGTNFGFFSGANAFQSESDYKADLTSYDYDAPIKEYGDVDNPKFEAIRRVIHIHTGALQHPIPSKLERERYGHVKVSKIATLFEALDLVRDPAKVVETGNPLAMELVGQMFGFLLYSTEFQERKGKRVLSISQVHDRAQVFVSCSGHGAKNPTYVGTMERWSRKTLVMPVSNCPSNVTLYILVENMGRINYGQYIFDRKGILSDVKLDDVALHGWKLYPISLDKVHLSKWRPVIQELNAKPDQTSVRTVLDVKLDEMRVLFHNVEKSDVPAFYEGHFSINHETKIKDTFISFRGWTKGVIFVNNFNLGRFWPAVGPQCTLYVPAPILQHGENTIVILELHSPNSSLTVDLVKDPDFTCGNSH